SEEKPIERFSSATLERIDLQRASAKLIVKTSANKTATIPCVKEPLASNAAGQAEAWFVSLYSP
ncbi:MAG: hypothetical protein PHU85_11870, partial [Phycisphaerae bacterium]|nr:hypothetical protein [Phycisphaerae bacterium]